MPDPSPQSGSASSRRRPAPPWLRLASVCVVLVVVPVALYLFLYQRSRVEDATIRNFRALDAAADRVDQVLARLSSVVDGSSFGISPSMFDEVTERLGGSREACGDQRSTYPAWDRPDFPDHLLRVRRPTAAQRLDFRYWYAAHVLFESDRKDPGATEAVWNQLHCLIDTHRKFSEPAAAVKVDVAPAPRVPLLARHPAHDDGVMNAQRRSLRELLEAEACSGAPPTPRLTAAWDGVAATMFDCRPLDARSRELHRALQSFKGGDDVIKAIDLFGVRSTASLDELMQQATGYLSRFFDSHLIADGDGLILFEAEAPTTADTEVDENHAATPAFSSYVDISEFLRGGSPSARGLAAVAGAGGGGNGGAAPAPYARGRSFVRVVGVEDIELRVFVHPFVLDSLGASDDSGPDPQAGPESSNRAARSTFYLIGVVDENEFRSAAIRLRLALVIDATLFLLALLTLTPLLWLWTAGDRLAVGPLALAGVCAVPVVGVALFTVLVCGAVTNRMDARALDRALEGVSDRIVELFDRELGTEVRRLGSAVPRLLRAAGDDPPRSRGGKARLPAADSGGAALTRLERKFYCDDADRNLDYYSERPEVFAATLLSDKGRSRVCLSEPGRAIPARTAPLELGFRVYFAKPRTGALWRPPPVTERRRPLCRVRDAQDEQSLIPCLVDRLPERRKRPFAFAGRTGPPDGGIEVPYFLERIDSVVGGQVTTILSVATRTSRTPVATSQAPLNALDRTVPPQHVDFAVVDRETGLTLFHSDDELAMTTNFAEDTGGDPALWSALRSGARDTVALVYAGIPIRAHLRPLRPGLPWTLVVYRGHELEDRVTVLTTALSIFFTLLWLFLAAAAAGLVLFVARWCSPRALAGLPVTLGRVMAAGSRLRWATPGAAAVVALLLYAPRLAWPVAGAWPVARVFPFFAVCSVLAVAAFLVGCALDLVAPTADDRRRPPAADRRGRQLDMAAPPKTHRRGAFGRIMALAGLIAGLAVAPSVLWFGHHRAALGVGLNHYLVDSTLDSVDRAREEYRLEMLARHGAPNAPAGDRTRRRAHREPAPRESWVYKALRPLVASSELANRLMIYRALPPVSADRAASLHDVFDRTFGYDSDAPPFTSPGSWRVRAAAGVWVILLTLLIATVASSICAVCTVVGRRRRGLVALPAACTALGVCRGTACSGKAGDGAGGPEDAPAPAEGVTGKGGCGRPLRAIVVYRSEAEIECFERRLTTERGLALSEHRVEKRADGRRHVRWDPAERGDAGMKAVYVFHLHEVLEDDADGRVLLDELERCVGDECRPVLIRSRVVPDYRYSDRPGSADPWFKNGRWDDADRRQRWNCLARQLRPYALRDTAACENGVERPSGSRDADLPRLVVPAMEHEVAANPDLLLAARVVEAEVVQYRKQEELSSEEACALAVTRFRKCAASRFNQAWTDSTRDERLQLRALAGGGVVDTRRTRVVSSLVNRGLVQEDCDTGVVRLCSRAFGEFIEHDVDHHELDAWRKEGGGGGWRYIWPPLAIGAALGLVFLAMANPEMQSALLTTLVGLLPATLPLLRGGSAGTTGSGG